MPRRCGAAGACAGPASPPLTSAAGPGSRGPARWLPARCGERCLPPVPEQRLGTAGAAPGACGAAGGLRCYASWRLTKLWGFLFFFLFIFKERNVYRKSPARTSSLWFRVPSLACGSGWEPLFFYLQVRPAGLWCYSLSWLQPAAVKVGTVGSAVAVREAVDDSERSIIFVPLSEKTVGTDSCSHKSCDGEGSRTKKELKGEGWVGGRGVASFPPRSGSEDGGGNVASLSWVSVSSGMHQPGVNVTGRGLGSGGSWICCQAVSPVLDCSDRNSHRITER